jgi:hypothetical protein
VEGAASQATAQGTAGEPTGVPPTGIAMRGGERPVLAALLVIVALAAMAGAGRRNRHL